MRGGGGRGGPGRNVREKTCELCAAGGMGVPTFSSCLFSENKLLSDVD